MHYRGDTKPENIYSLNSSLWYYKGMKTNTKSSITLPPHELKLVNDLMKSLKAKSKVEVIRRGLFLLKETTDRNALRASYKEASEKARKFSDIELQELNELTDDGLDE